jgi:hypothetical protein
MTTKLVEKHNHRTATFELDVCTQMWAGLYTEPIQGKPETYEDEHKQFVFDRRRYEEVRVKLLKKSQEIQADIYKYMGYEAANLTYSQVTWAMGQIPPDSDLPDKRYTATEDLQFLYHSLAEIWNCLYELECVFD